MKDTSIIQMYWSKIKETTEVLQLVEEEGSKVCILYVQLHLV